MASVDLSHVGPQFGDERPVSQGDLNDLRDEDLGALRPVEAMDKEGFWQEVTRDGNRRNICGLSAIYVTLRLLAGHPCEILGYDQAPDPSGQGVVSFCSAVIR